MIFEEQISRKPDHYPWAGEFIEAMHNGFWTDKEFSFTSDLQDFNVVLSDQEKEIIVRTLSAIGQIEVAVKKFWSKLGDNLPHQIGTNGASGCGLTACNDGVTLEGDCLDLSALPANYMATVPDDPQAVAPGSLTRYYLTVGTLNEITIGSCDEEAEGAGGTGAAPVIELTR